MGRPPNDGLRWTGRFADPAAEAAYRLSRLPADRSLARMVVAAVLVLDAVYILVDAALLGLTVRLAVLCGLRAGVTAWSWACWRWLGRADAPAAVEGRMLVWAGPLLAFNAAILVALPYTHIGSAAVFAVAVVMAYLAPLTLARQVLAGGLVAVMYLGVMTAKGWPLDPVHTGVATAAGFVVANGVGAAFGVRAEGVRRRQYTSSQALERALAELRTLRGLLPVCACCKIIRDDAGQWQRMEAYIQARTHAQFSHGICPSCLETEYGVTPADLGIRAGD